MHPKRFKIKRAFDVDVKLRIFPYFTEEFKNGGVRAFDILWLVCDSEFLVTRSFIAFLYSCKNLDECGLSDAIWTKHTDSLILEYVAGICTECESFLVITVVYFDVSPRGKCF